LRTQPNAAHSPVEVIEVCSEAALQLSAKPQRDDGCWRARGGQQLFVTASCA
jgi:hypothetical protein